MSEEEQSKISRLEERVAHLERTQNEKLERIEAALVGDSRYKQRGLAERVKDNEESINAINRAKIRAGGVVSVLIFIASSLTSWAIYILKDKFT